jgi:hypothetical protein
MRVNTQNNNAPIDTHRRTSTTTTTTTMTTMPSQTAREASLAAFATAMAYGTAYITAATAIIMLNKYMLSVTAFHYPIVLSSMGVVCGWTLSLIGVYTGKVDISNHGDITFGTWAKNVLPIGFFQGTTLMLGCVREAKRSEASE